MVAEVTLGIHADHGPDRRERWGSVMCAKDNWSRLVCRMVIDLVRGDVWVEANYKETQLTNIRKGDVADITIDTFLEWFFMARWQRSLRPVGRNSRCCPLTTPPATSQR